MADSAWPYVAVLVGPRFKDFRTVGTWRPHEKQIAIDWCCEWWHMMYGSEPDTVKIYGEYSDDHKALIYNEGHDHMIVLCQLGEAYREDVHVQIG